MLASQTPDVKEESSNGEIGIERDVCTLEASVGT